MAKHYRSKRSGALLALTALGVATFSSPTITSAETVISVNGISIDSTLVNMYLESRIQKLASQATPDERDAIVQELTDIYLLTMQPEAEELANGAKVKAQIELQSRTVIAQAVASNFFTKNKATDEEIVAEYESQMGAATSLQFKARHILVETQAAAVDLISQLADGADFEELAKTSSTGPSGPSGGDLGWFAPDQMVKPFSDAVAALEDGGFTLEPVQTQFGWHVILREESRPNEPPPLASVRDEIKQRIEQAKFEAYLENLRASQVNQN